MSSERRAALAYALWMLGWVALAVVRRHAGWCVAGGAVGLGVRLWAARGTWTPSGRFGVANALTAVRLGVVISLPWLFAALPRALFAGVVLGIFALDGLDGWWARGHGEASRFGAAFDMETDALTVMTLSLLLWLGALAGPWVLVAGLWRYGYASLVALSPRLGEAPPSRFGRWVFCLLMLSFTAAFLAGPRLSPLFAALGTLLVSISFLRSLAASRR